MSTQTVLLLRPFVASRACLPSRSVHTGRRTVKSAKGRLATSLQPTGKAKKLGSLHVVRPPFARDVVPHRGRQPKKPVANPLEEQFDLSTPSLLANADAVPANFASPPLFPGLLQSVKETLSQDATPTAIQALSMKHMMMNDDARKNQSYEQYLLASETGSGKSLAYLLPLLQDLKRTELAARDSDASPSSLSSPSPSPPLRPRALILAPTHELSRQLARFAKDLSHVIKLRIRCVSRANKQSTARRDGTASKMKMSMDAVFGDSDTRDVAVLGGRAPHQVDVLVGTPMKLLELEKGKGWNWEERARERASRKDSGAAPDRRTFWVDKPEMGLENVEWVVVDEADVLFDPDFEASTRQLLADIAAAKGQPVPIASLDATRPTPDAPRPISYPFHLVLTSATIPNALSDYLATHHPALTRLASPNLHHLPSTLRTEHAKWTGGNKDADIERRIRRVWAEDALAHAKRAGTHATARLSKLIVFCNKKSKVEQLAAFLRSRGIASVALTGEADARQRGNDHHLDGFLASRSGSGSGSNEKTEMETKRNGSGDPAKTPHVLVTTSLLSRGLDFGREVKHVFIVDEPRNMIDFIHRAGRTGRAGESGKVVVFGRAAGRGSGRTERMRERVRALV